MATAEQQQTEPVDPTETTEPVDPTETTEPVEPTPPDDDGEHDDGAHDDDDQVDDELDDDQQQPAPAEPAAPAGALTEKEIEKRMGQLAKEAQRHTGAISRIMGEDALELEVCPLCWDHTPGFRFPTPVQGEQRDAVLTTLGLADEVELDKAPDARECEKCHGRGRVLTGSRVDLHRTKACGSCNGTGYVLVTGPAPTNGATVATTAPSPVIDQPAETPSDADPWGRLPGDPNYGRLPQYATA